MEDYNIKFHLPFKSGDEINDIEKCLNRNFLKGDGWFTNECNASLKKILNTNFVDITTSGTASLELTALIENLTHDDEIIMPSYTFVSTANAFVLRGAKIKFVDIDPLTMNINPNLIENAITKKTKAIVIVHYGGISCDMKKILDITNKYKLILIEDAAQGIDSYYNNQHVGTFGDYGCLSFHQTKNINCGEGGAIITKSKSKFSEMKIIREKGTNRNEYINGVVDKYTWKNYGSSYLPSELQTAFLYSQLNNLKTLTEKRLKVWNFYNDNFKDNNYFKTQVIPKYASTNGHIYFIKANSKIERTKLIEYLNKKGIEASFHYIPLHNTDYSKKFCQFVGEDKYTTLESEKIVRLPSHHLINDEDLEYIVNKVYSFYK